MLGLDRAGGDLEGGEQRGRAAPLVFVGLAVERAAIGQLEIALRPLEGLDRRLLIDREDDRMVGRIEVEADDVGGLGGELGVARETPGFAPGEVDPLRPQKAPDVLVADVAEFLGEQRRGPARRSPRAAAGRAAPGCAERRPRRRSSACPERGASASPARRSLANRTRHRLTTPRAHPTSRAIARLPQPSPARSTIRARSTRRCSVLPERTQPVSVARSAAVSAIGVASCIAMPNQ